MGPNQAGSRFMGKVYRPKGDWQAIIQTLVNAPVHPTSSEMIREQS
jgi:hypothetical protein